MILRVRRRVALVLAAAILPACGRVDEPRPVVPPAASKAPAPPVPAKPVVKVATKPVELPIQFVLSPNQAVLDLKASGLQLLAHEMGPGNHLRDVTTEVSWEVDPPERLTIETGGYARPKALGKVAVHARLAGRSIGEASVEVVDVTSAARSWDFAADIVPILTRYGCNTGGCHGRADGQNGFHLSFFGYDPDHDHLALTHEAAGRRINPVAPASSLLLTKATGSTAHGGGARISRTDPAYRTLVDWVAAGAPRNRGAGHGPLAAVRIEPGHLLLARPGPFALRVVARFEDGTERDVTRLAAFRSNDDSVSRIDSEGRGELLRRGETDLVVRYQSQVLAVRVGAVINPDLVFDFKRVPRHNLIDTQLLTRLEALRVPPSPAADDASFLRRVSLDLTGQLPSPDEIRTFLGDPARDRRARKVEELMGRREFLKFWAIKFGDLLQISSTRFPNSAGYYQMWLEKRLSENATWDDMVRELLTALGNPATREGGAANFALDGPEAKIRAEQAAQRFLGLRLRCAQCHDHPFDVWTQDDYFGFAAFFAKAQAGGAGAGPEMMARPEVRLVADASVEHLRTKQPAEPRLLHESTPPIEPTADPRRTLADWMTRPGNPYFARAFANWAWAQFFGRGLADPPDDLSAANPPTHPELLDALARHFEESGYDVRDLLRMIALSHAYELSSEPVPGNETDQRLFSHHRPRPLTAHQMADALAQATDVPNLFPNRARGTRAIDVFDPANESTILDTFGRCSRTLACSSVAVPPLSLRQSLLLIGGDTVNAKVASLNGYLANLLQITTEPADIVENLYLRTLCRLPSAEERSHWVAELTAAGSLPEASEDLFWALLNSREFAFNH